ncbi:MAG: porin family protein [Bacteroidota bacterium]
MKILFFIFFLPCCFFSQEKSNVFNFLINVGVSPSQVHGDSYSGFHKVGFIGGVGVETIFSDKLKASLSFLYIQKGARKNQNPQKNDFNAYYLNLNYVEIPLLLTYTSNKKYIFDIGVSTGYLIDYYESNQIGNYTGLYPFKKFEYSVKVGLGYNISDKWFVNFRSSNSFLTIRPNYIKQSIYYNNFIARYFNKGYYNNILEFTIGYRIKIKH